MDFKRVIKIIIVLVLCLVLYKNCLKKESYYVKRLPANARVIEEFNWNEGFLPDYTYFLKAEISKEGFSDYVNKLEMNLHYEDRVYSDNIGVVEVRPMFEEVKEWWDVSMKPTDTLLYVWQKGTEINIAKFKEGKLYLYAMKY